MDLTLPVSITDVEESRCGWPVMTNGAFAEIVQDRASELLTEDFENKQRCREIADELYQLATRML